jgi:hypothetical protein
MVAVLTPTVVAAAALTHADKLSPLEYLLYVFMPEQLLFLDFRVGQDG